MSAEHTPGPWAIPHMATADVSCNCAYILAGEYCGGIAEIYVDNGKSIKDGGNDCPPISEAKANARLIAAAPELLSDLRLAAKTLRRYEVLHRAKGTADSDEKANVNASLATQFEATIAKATGSAT